MAKAADNKKQKCATSVSDKDGFKAFQLKGYPANLSEARMKIHEARDMAAGNLRNLAGDCVAGGLRCPKVGRTD